MTMKKNFRPLLATEIDCRVGTCSEKGCALLLYKDARVDMNLLDETFGPFAWKREHQVIDGNLYCTVSIKDPETGEWVSKQDVGTESNTEKEKGQASDSFKRACVNWGIGRELYSSPFIWITSADCAIKPGKNGKPTTYDRFRVTYIEYDPDRVSGLEIVNDSRRGQVVYTYGSRKGRSGRGNAESAQATETPESPVPVSPTDAIGRAEWNEIKAACKAVGLNDAELLERYQIERPSQITYSMRDDMIAYLAKYNG